MVLIKYDNTGKFQWVKSYGGDSYNYGRGVTCDKSDNIYITGGYRTSLQFGDTSLTASNGGLSNVYNIFLGKLSPEGEEQWIRQAGGGEGSARAFNIAKDISDDIFISGQLNSNTATFGNINVQSNSTSNIFIAKYSSNGNSLWVKILESYGGYDFWPFYKTGTDVKGSCYIGGADYGNLKFDGNIVLDSTDFNNFVAKFETDGTLGWIKSFGVPQPETGFSSAFCLTVYGEDNLVACGRITNDVGYFDNTAIGTTNENGFIAMLGNFQNGINDKIKPEVYFD